MNPLPFFLLLTVISLASANTLAAKEITFRLHLVTEPQSIDVQKQHYFSAGYFQSQIQGTLLKWQNGFKPNLATSCDYRTPTHLICKLRKNLKYSDGSSIQSKDFLNSYKRLLTPTHRAPQADLLFPVKNALQFYKGEITDFSKVGFQATKDEIHFHLVNNNYEFIYNLTTPILAPLKTDSIPDKTKYKNLVSSGPYKIINWTAGKAIDLVPNPNFWSYNSALPNVQMLFIPEDTAALRLYENNELDFLRRLPTLYIKKYSSRTDFHAIAQHRLDYIGFAPHVADFEMRKNMTLSLDYLEWQKLYKSTNPPGCPGLSKKLYLDDICYTKTKLTVTYPKTNLTLYFAKQGGDDHKRAMEWVQNQWIKNLGMKIQIQSIDQKILPLKVAEKSADIFRKGIAAQAPTCFSLLRSFLSSESDNISGFKSTVFDGLVNSLPTLINEGAKKEKCHNALKILMDSYQIIPTGEIYFSILVKSKWTGWNLNELNQLDLSNLNLVSK